MDECTARAARERAPERGISVNRHTEELLRQDTGEADRAFVEAAADFMKLYESVFAEGFGTVTSPGQVRDLAWLVKRGEASVDDIAAELRRWSE